MVSILEIVEVRPEIFQLDKSAVQPLNTFNRTFSSGIRQEDKKLTSAASDNEIHISEIFFEQGCESLQQEIPDMVAKGVVVVFEVVKIDK